jgi:hypothetical protein
MRRTLGLSGFVRFLRTLTLGLVGFIAMQSCSESATAPRADSKVLLADGSVAYVYHYPDSVRYGPGTGWVSVSPNEIVDNALTPDKPAFVAAAPTSTYNVTSVPFAPEASVPTTAGLGPTNDFSVKPNVPIGFTFNFFGNAYTTVNISSSGLVQFGNPQTKDGCCWGWFIARNDDINNVIALGWSAWTASAVSRPIRYELRGTAPNRRFVIQYFNLPEDGGGGKLSAQLILYEGTNDIVLYTTQLNTTIKRHSITQGLENNPGTEASFVAGRDSALFSIANDGVKFSLAHVNTAPAITQPADLSINTDAGLCAASPSVAPPAFTDDAPGATIAGVRSDGLALNAAYPKGTTTITWTATDVEGLKSSVTQNVIVADKEKPALTAPGNIGVRVNVTVSFASVNVGTATITSDNCHDATVSGTRSDNAPLIAGYPLGVTTITWTALDASGNSATATQTVTVTPNVAPQLMLPPNIVVNTDANACVATIASVGTPTVKDDLAGSTYTGERLDGQALNAPYPKGVTTIKWTATDADGASVSANQTVTVNDKEAPSLDAVSNVSVRQDRGVAHAAVSLSQPAITSDNCHDASVSVSRSDNAPLSAVFPVGVTTVTWSATDGSGNVTRELQTVTVVGNVPPVVKAPANISTNTDANVCVATVNLGTPTVTDDIDGWSVAGSRSDGQPLNAAYPKGVTTVTWTATDYDYATASANQTVSVADKQKPEISAPASLSVPNDHGLATAVVATGSPAVSDNCPQVSFTGSRSDGAGLGAAYPVGVTTITWTATDASGNTASATQTITVRDVDPPVLLVPNDFSVNATMPSGAVVTYSVNATDNVGVVSLVCVPTSGSVFPIGYTHINCVARDAAGNSASGEFGVEVMGADDQLENLIDYVRSLGLPNGTENPLVNQLRVAQHLVGDAQACTKLDDFIHMVSVKNGTLSSTQSQSMVRDARRIQAVLGCAGVPASTSTRLAPLRTGLRFNRNPGR